MEIKKLLKSREMKQFMALRDELHRVCALLNRDCYLCYQMFPAIYAVCSYVRNIEHFALEAILGSDNERDSSP